MDTSINHLLIKEEYKLRGQGYLILVPQDQPP